MNIVLVMFTQSIPFFPLFAFERSWGGGGQGGSGKKKKKKYRFGKLSQIPIYLSITVTNKITATFLRAVIRIYNSND